MYDKTKLLKKIIKISEILDKNKHFVASDILINMVKRVVLAYMPGPLNLELPLKTRVIPYGLMKNEFNDVDKWRQQFPRYKGKEFEQDSEEDQEDRKNSIFELNNSQGTGITQRIVDQKTPGYMGLDHFKWDNIRDPNKKGYPKYTPN